MTAVELPLAEKVAAIHGALDGAAISHAFGGALALAYYAEPRATIDIDVNVFASPGQFATVMEALEPLGVAAGDAADLVERDGQCRLWWGRTPVDLFFAYDDVHEAMQEGARRMPFGEQSLPVLSAEHLLVCKAAFDRAKDWIDIEQMLVAADLLDVEEADRWLIRLLGEDDFRRSRFLGLARELRPS